MTVYDRIAVAAGVLMCVGLWFAANYADSVKHPMHRLLWLLPLPLLLAADRSGLTRALIPMYLGGALLAAGFFRESLRFRRVISAVSAGLIALSAPLCMIDPKCHAKPYRADFDKAFGVMRRHYVLTKHKGIDWDALYGKYAPLFDAAEDTNDPVDCALAWAGFCGEFHDGHVNYLMNAGKSRDKCALMQETARRAFGNDYGLSVMRLADGSFAAVNTDAALAAYGITDGTVITAWDGVSPDAAAKKSLAYDKCLICADESMNITLDWGSFPDADNAEFYSALLAAGVGGDSVTVTYLAADGTEQTAVLPKTGDYLTRITRTLDIIDQGVPIGDLEWTQLNAATACLRIKDMSYDSRSYSSPDTASYWEMEMDIRQAVEAFRAQGVQDVVIDLRGNSGGSGTMVEVLASLFAPEGEHFYVADAAWDEANNCYLTGADGNYQVGEKHFYKGKDVLQGGRVVLLVNASSISAADHMVHAMRGLENVTVMGFTEPNGSAQAINGVTTDSVSLMFSSCAMLEEDGGIFIDAGRERQSGNGLDVRVPFDAAAVRALFTDGRDYVMERALAYLAENG